MSFKQCKDNFNLLRKQAKINKFHIIYQLAICIDEWMLNETPTIVVTEQLAAIRDFYFTIVCRNVVTTTIFTLTQILFPISFHSMLPIRMKLPIFFSE